MTETRLPAPLDTVESARQRLAQVETVDEAAHLVDVAETAKKYARTVLKSLEEQNNAARVSLMAQRRAGELLAAYQLRGGDRRSNAHRERLKLGDLGIGHNQSTRWQAIAQIDEVLLEAHVQTILALPTAELTTAGVLKAVEKERKEQEKAERLATIGEAEVLTSLGPFPVLYADPPWRYDDAEPTRQVENHYPTMGLDEIAALEVPAADDAVLFLWVTSPKLVEGVHVLDAWGFDYRTCLVWVKDRIGMGYYARQQHELLFVGKRGSLPVPDPEDRPSSVIEAPRGEHSAKPDVVYELIERMYPFAERCELFQRRPRPGWAGWGNQA